MAQLEQNNFSGRLKTLHVAKGLSQSELGDLSKVHYTHIGKYERNESKPSMETIQLLANCLSVTVDYLLNGMQENAAIANLEDTELLKMFTELEKLPTEDKEVVKKLIDAYLIKRRFQKELAG